MGARRFFVPNAHDVGDVLSIEGADAHKIERVLRLRAGDAIEIVDSSSQLFDAALESVNGVVTARLISMQASSENAQFEITVAQGIPKGQKMDFAIEKLSELGAAAIIPFSSERTVVRDLGPAKMERWRRIAEAAAKQSGRTTLMAVSEPTTLEGVVSWFNAYDVVLMPWEVAESAPLRETLPPIVHEARRVLLVIGPEGGFSHAEAERAAAAGAHLITLGPRILRTETAALALVSILQYIGH
jgi:16S rRNA (uracil1498-N3)-methyltransferase